MITDNYIKMCEQAEEIQRECHFYKGDWFYCQDERYEVLDDGIYGKNTAIEFKKDKAWIPALEQLFEIILDLRNKDARIKAKEYEIMADFIDWMLNTDIDQYKDFNLDFSDTKSCILIYLMERFYNKVWTGEKWEKE